MVQHHQRCKKTFWSISICFFIFVSYIACWCTSAYFTNLRKDPNLFCLVSTFPFQKILVQTLKTIMLIGQLSFAVLLLDETGHVPIPVVTSEHVSWNSVTYLQWHWTLDDHHQSRLQSSQFFLKMSFFNLYVHLPRCDVNIY